MPAARLTPDDNEARSNWWISSKAYFDGFIGQVERVPFDLSRQNMYEIPSNIYREFDEQKREIKRNKKEVDNIKKEMRKFSQEMNVHLVRQENKEPIIVEQYYGLSDFSQFQSMQGGPSSFQEHVKTHISIWVRHRISKPQCRPNLVHMIGKDRCRRSRTLRIGNLNIPNRGKREQFPSKYKLTPFMEQPPTTILPQQRVNKTKNKGKKANLSPLNLGGAFEDDNVEENNHMNSWMELLIRRRNEKANWTVAYTAKYESGKAYEKCRDIPLEQRDLIEIFLKTKAELDYQMNNALLLKATKLEKQIRDKTAWIRGVDGVGEKLGVDEVPCEKVIVDKLPGELTSRPTHSSFYKKNPHP
uniref:Uncharacterized protein n=1 Tax=Tanacetum cinerariifolium TaxID=118510 RepID=A0A6L2KRX6_TANCI|nr:hypothetical protein [Tanacetum cinerariifolium]